MHRLPVLLVVAILSCAARRTTGDGCRLVDEGFGPKGAVPVRAEAVAVGLEVPWGLAFLPGGDALVTERPGRVRLVRAIGARKDGDAAKLPLVARIAVDASDEGGLLGIALHPQFEKNRLFYLYMTVREGGRKVNRVERWKLSPDSGSAVFEKRILDGIPSAAFHDGGRIRFGPDGMLYVGTGDGREPERSQDPASLGGKILRLTPDGEVPRDNPLPGNAAFIVGIRNTQGFDWRDATHLYVTDHGPSGELMRQGHDEVNVATAGANLGWPRIYGCEALAGMVTPLLTWTRSAPPGGAAIYTGRDIPEWRGSLMVGTLRSEHLHRVKFTDADPARVELHETYFEGQLGRLREVQMGPDGRLYVATSNCDGRGDCPPERDKILRIVHGPGGR